MYPKSEERITRLKVIEQELQTYMVEREKILNIINILMLEKRILENLEVLDEAEQGNISLSNIQQE